MGLVECLGTGSFSRLKEVAEFIKEVPALRYNVACVVKPSDGGFESLGGDPFKFS